MPHVIQTSGSKNSLTAFFDFVLGEVEVICEILFSSFVPRFGADSPTHTGQQWEDNVSIVSPGKHF